MRVAHAFMRMHIDVHIDVHIHIYIHTYVCSIIYVCTHAGVHPSHRCARRAVISAGQRHQLLSFLLLLNERIYHYVIQVLYRQALHRDYVPVKKGDIVIILPTENQRGFLNFTQGKVHLLAHGASISERRQ